jgi:outer membrane protein assembly factor BamD (BamD/ComL family)
MTGRSFRCLAVAALAAAAFFLVSCASGPAQIPPGLSAVEIFQRAQDASDGMNYPLALQYYSLISVDFPTDTARVTWAAYEIAFLYHKMGKEQVALERINALLDQYATGGDQLPPAPRVLAAKLKARLEEALKTAS